MRKASPDLPLEPARDGHGPVKGGRPRPGMMARHWTAWAASAALALATGCGWLTGGRTVMDRIMTRDMTPQDVGGDRAGTRGLGPDVTLGGPTTAGSLIPSPDALAGPGQRPGNPESWGESSRLGVARQFDPIRFGAGETELDLGARRQLMEIADWLKVNPRVWTLMAGHCSRSVTTRYAYGVGMERALAAREFLVTQGVQAWRVYCISYGTDRLAAAGASPDANALNDRVEVSGFLQPDGVAAPKPVDEMGKNAPPSRAADDRHVTKELPR